MIKLTSPLSTSTNGMAPVAGRLFGWSAFGLSEDCEKADSALFHTNPRDSERRRAPNLEKDQRSPFDL